jgi:hypothetical protein
MTSAGAGAVEGIVWRQRPADDPEIADLGVDAGSARQYMRKRPVSC